MKTTSPDSDLIQRVKKSDAGAFRVLFERYQPIVFRQVLLQTQEPDAAHDIVQETFVRVWEKRSSLRPDLGILAFLLRISGNLVRDAARYRQTRERLAHSIPLPHRSEGDDPEQALHLSMLSEQLSSVIHNELPEQCRVVFVLSRFEGKTTNEIATLLNLRERTVERHMNRALTILRKKLRIA